MNPLKRIAFTLVIVSNLFLMHCSHSNELTIGGKNFSEQSLLVEILKQYVETHSQITVVKKTYLGGTFVCHNALTSDKIDIYVEYTGTAINAILKQESINDSKNAFHSVKNTYQKKYLNY